MLLICTATPGHCGCSILLFSHMVWSRERNGKRDAALHCPKKRGGIFCITSGNASPTFQIEKSIFNQMPHFVQFFILFSLHFSIRLWRNSPCPSSLFYIFQNHIGMAPLSVNSISVPPTRELPENNLLQLLP